MRRRALRAGVSGTCAAGLVKAAETMYLHFQRKGVAAIRACINKHMHMHVCGMHMHIPQASSAISPRGMLCGSRA